MSSHALICPECHAALRIAEGDRRVGFAFDCPDCRQPLLLRETADGPLRAARRPTTSATVDDGAALAAGPCGPHDGPLDKARDATDGPGRVASRPNAFPAMVRPLRSGIVALAERWLASPVCVAFSATAVFAFALLWTTSDSPTPPPEGLHSASTSDAAGHEDALGPANGPANGSAARSTGSDARNTGGEPSASGSDASPPRDIAASVKEGGGAVGLEHGPPTLPAGEGNAAAMDASHASSPKTPKRTSGKAGGDGPATDTSGKPPGRGGQRSATGKLLTDLSEESADRRGHAGSAARVAGAQRTGEQSADMPMDGPAAPKGTSTHRRQPAAGDVAADPDELRAALATPLAEFTTTRPLTARELLVQLEQLLGHPITVADDARTQAALSAKIQLQMRAVSLRDLIGEVCRRAGLHVSFEPYVSVRAAPESGASHAAAQDDTQRAGAENLRRSDRATAKDDGSR